MSENCDVQSRQMFEVSPLSQTTPFDARWPQQEMLTIDNQYVIPNIATKNEPIYHYITDGSGSTGHYLPVVTIGADGKLIAVTDPSCLPSYPSVVPVDVGEEVIVFPDKSENTEAESGDGVVEINVDASADDASQNAIMPDPTTDQLPIVTTFRPVATPIFPKNQIATYSVGSLQYLQGGNRTVPIILQAPTPARKVGKFQCNVCLKTFSQQVNLQTHQRIHTGERPFKCQICCKAFTQQPNLWKHMRTHTGERPFQCRICQKCFTQQGNLSKHEKIHTGEKPFKCPTCDKAFAQRSNLMTHLTLHTGVRPFRCLVCDKSFAQRANLLTHNMTHTGERPYKCEVCQKGFSQQANLVKHVRLHTGERPYTCRFCSRTFAQQANLDRHERIHTGVKPYACKSCWRAFGQKTNLQKHEATHHQEKAFPCFLCRKAFVAKATLEKHQQKVHAHQMYPNCCVGKAHHSENCGPPANDPISINKIGSLCEDDDEQHEALMEEEEVDEEKDLIEPEIKLDLDDQGEVNMEAITVEVDQTEQQIHTVRIVSADILQSQDEGSLETITLRADQPEQEQIQVKIIPSVLKKSVGLLPGLIQLQVSQPESSISENVVTDSTP